MKRFAVAITCALLAVSTPAYACEYVSTHFKLPSESEESSHARARERFEQTGLLIKFRQQFDMLKNSEKAYVAVRVSEPSEGVREPSADPLILERMPSAYVRPVAAIKGELPSTDLRLLETSALWGANCWAMEDGWGATAEIGDPLIVFEELNDVPFAKSYPRNLFSERADRLVVEELEQAIAAYLSSETGN